MSPPKCFISYAWESDELKKWVLDLACELRNNAVDVILDQWNLLGGIDLPHFMESSVRESDFVLLICTPAYSKKANNLEGGVGYEKTVITGELLSSKNLQTNKFIPILYKGNAQNSLPSYMRSRVYIDFRDNSKFKTSLQELLESIYPKLKKIPPLGQKPVAKSNFVLGTKDNNRTKSAQTVFNKEKKLPENNNKKSLIIVIGFFISIILVVLIVVFTRTNGKNIPYEKVLKGSGKLIPNYLKKEKSVSPPSSNNKYIDICDLEADWIRGPAYGMQGSSIDIGIQYTNKGNNTTDVMTYYYLSDDPTYDSEDFYLGKYGPFASIKPDQTIYHSYGVLIQIPADAPAGTWYLIYLLKSGNYHLIDSNSSNDYTSYYPFTIQSMGKRCKIWIPNWHCEGPPHDTKSVYAGNIYKFHREVRNEGPDHCSTLVLNYYWSIDGVIDESDEFLSKEALSLDVTNDWNFINLKIPTNAVSGRKYWIGFTLSPKDCSLEQYEQEKNYSTWDVIIK